MYDEFELDPNEVIAEFTMNGDAIAYLFMDIEDCTVDIEFVDGTDSITEEANIDDCELIGLCADQLGVNPLDVELKYYSEQEL